MHRFALPLLVGFGLASLACGSGTTGGAIPSESTLCELGVGKSSPADAISLLGKPVSDQASSSWRNLMWLYDKDGQAASASVFLRFEDDVLVDTSVNSLAFPTCWKKGGGN